jgi:hypothetical protein
MWIDLQPYFRNEHLVYKAHIRPFYVTPDYASTTSAVHERLCADSFPLYQAMIGAYDGVTSTKLRVVSHNKITRLRSSNEKRKILHIPVRK